MTMPQDRATAWGPRTSREQRGCVVSYCMAAGGEGVEILLGGKAPSDAELAKGCYVMPTVVRARPKDRVCQEEVFGPFVTVTTFKHEDEVIAVANDTVYGLGGGLWTTNLSRAHRVARQIITGMVWINCYKRANPGSPFGGVRSSGYGRDLGIESIEEYTSPKSMWVNGDAKLPAY